MLFMRGVSGGMGNKEKVPHAYSSTRERRCIELSILLSPSRDWLGGRNLSRTLVYVGFALKKKDDDSSMGRWTGMKRYLSCIQGGGKESGGVKKNGIVYVQCGMCSGRGIK